MLQPELLQELRLLHSAQADIPAPTSESQYTGYINRKSDWQPAHYQDTRFKPSGAGTHIALQKAMALALELEVPVGLFTLAATKRDFAEDQRWALLDNSADELVHYEALSNWMAGGAHIEPEHLDQARQYRMAIEELEEHEVVKSGYVELGVFFIVLALFRKFGDPSLKLLASDISRDEATHVLTNWAIIEANEIPWAASKLNDMRRELIHWLTSDIKNERYGYDFWEDQSQRLISTKQADGLKFTKTGMYSAFFEVANTSLASY